MGWPSNSPKIITETFILAGAVIMLFTLIYSRNVFNYEYARRYSKRWKLIQSVMVVFLCMYIAAFIIAFYENYRVFVILTGVVLVLGSIFIHLAIRTSFLTMSDMGRYVSELEISLATQRQLEDTLQARRTKLSKQNDALFYLTRKIWGAEPIEDSLKLLTEKTAEVLEADRVSIWVFDEQKNFISCADLFTRQKSMHSHEPNLYKKDYPTYFAALETDGIVDAVDARSDPRTAEYADTYLKPRGITSMLDASIHLEGETKGILCAEITGPQRTWTIEEKSFIAALTDIIAITVETVKRKEITEQLALSESTFRNAFEYSGVGMGIVSSDGKWLKVNKELCRMVGYSEDELLKMTFQDITHPDDLPANLQLVDDTMDGKRDSYKMEKRYMHKNGLVVWVNITSSLVKDSNGKPLFFFSQAEDITERKKIRRDLELSLSLTRATLDSTEDGILVVDNSGKISDYNKQFVKLWRIPEEVIETHDDATVMGYAVQQLMYPDKFEKRVKELYAHPSEDSQDIIKFTDGRVFERYSKPQKTENEIVGRVWSFRDVTKQKRAENEIRQLNAELENRVTQRTLEINKLNEDLKANIRNLELANKDLESFTYSVSHDLRAPLRTIKGFISLVEKRNTSLDPDSKKFLTVISDSASKMDTLIEDLLAFSRLGKKELETTNLDMNELLHEVVAGINIHEWNHNTKLLIGNLLPVNGDKNLLKQVFFNLISNSVKYSRTKENPVIEIGSYSADGEHIYFIKDNGVGFSMDYYKKLFNVFQRMHSAAEFEGVGVGLAIVQRIIIKHGGRVWAEAKVNEGATFSFALPARINSAAEPAILTTAI